MPIEPIMTVADLNRFLDTDFSEVHTDGKVFEVVAVGPGSATMRFDPNEKHLRPGGTVSGPALFALADVTAYVALLAHIGPVALAVTTNLNINFLRKPRLGALECTCRILKLGKRLAVLDAAIVEQGGVEFVAHATATYSIPPR
ncbi:MULTISPECIES: PaaI family thioesterase [unclassified Rhizobium]|uniref:PaaI family thioesterase n=1 Tax=unclassified Rhizobium TaxID=2613769 RepID=UPI000715C659|nr:MULTISPECIES: PaaI family thioesterase [unclassified Rhizobium]KQS93906.1 thioesterase [Rhizobium sp. Leaf386]KQT06577.1 thioesterase [Rhizobium sp. Leaf391]KQU05006.1 thioesterase [Rhizobium sp. Leaf453]